MGPSPWQLLIVLLVVLLIFGTKKLRGMGSDLGTAIKGFKDSVADKEEKDADALDSGDNAQAKTAEKSEETSA